MRNMELALTLHIFLYQILKNLCFKKVTVNSVIRCIFEITAAVLKLKLAQITSVHWYIGRIPYE